MMTIDEFYQPAKLGIIVQGPLSKNNIMETANFCCHWRYLFPKSEIILAISVTDILVGHLADGILRDIHLSPAFQYDRLRSNALSVLLEVCTAITMAAPALPLPPIKRDNPKLNNINFQISAAQAGLALVKSKYVLRIRSDLIFLDHTFLTDYIKGCALARGKASVFEQRVMISWLYTLNPYSIERLPLHFSDWFHLGLTRDVARIWDVPPVTLADALHYACHDYLPGSNNVEQLFLVKTAVEQYLSYHVFKSAFPSLRLEAHNDLRSRELGMSILADNFVVCDVHASKGVFDKYNHEFFDKTKRLHCITAEMWRELCLSPQEPPFEVIRRVTQAEVQGGESLAWGTKEQGILPSSVIAVDSSGSFPLCYNAFQLKIKEGVIKNNEIVGCGKDGTVFFGPYITLPRGAYVVRIYCSHIAGGGTVTCRVTANAGQRELVQKSEAFQHKIEDKTLEVHFSVREKNISEVEVVLSTRGVAHIAVRQVQIDLSYEVCSPEDVLKYRKDSKFSKWFKRDSVF